MRLSSPIFRRERRVLRNRDGFQLFSDTNNSRFLKVCECVILSHFLDNETRIILYKISYLSC